MPVYCTVHIKAKVYFSGDNFSLKDASSFLSKKREFNYIPEEALSKEGEDRLPRMEASV
jgi:hypothetical protein